jgi:hypothetical protein
MGGSMVDPSPETAAQWRAVLASLLGALWVQLYVCMCVRLCKWGDGKGPFCGLCQGNKVCFVYSLYQVLQSQVRTSGIGVLGRRGVCRRAVCGSLARAGLVLVLALRFVTCCWCQEFSWQTCLLGMECVCPCALLWCSCSLADSDPFLGWAWPVGSVVGRQIPHDGALRAGVRSADT